MSVIDLLFTYNRKKRPVKRAYFLLLPAVAPLSGGVATVQSTVHRSTEPALTGSQVSYGYRLATAEHLPADTWLYYRTGVSRLKSRDSVFCPKKDKYWGS